MNREFKRRMKRDERAQQRAVARGSARPPIPQQAGKRERVGFRQYIREIQAELKRVNWPTSSEVLTYGVVVIFVVTLLTLVVFALDLGFAQGIIELFRPQT